MNNSKAKPVRMPAYLKEFRCIGPACEDNCCIGWDVEFDKKSYKKYMKVTDQELGQLFQKYVRPNRFSFSSEVDYAKVSLTKNKRCPFLDGGNLCRIQAKLGEDYLSNVCATYPRYTNEIDGILEHSANMSCPEAARLALLRPEGMAFSSGESAGQRHITSFSVDTRSQGGGCLPKYLLELRQLSIDMIQCRRLPLDERMCLLGSFFAELQRLEDSGRTGGVPKLIATFRQAMSEKNPEAIAGAASRDAAFQLKLLRELVDKLNVFTEVDSTRYVSLMEEVLKGIQYNRKATPAENAKRYAIVSRHYCAPFMKEHGYVIENYLVNFIFGALFPALDVQRLFDAYIMLALLYALIKFHLTGLAACRRGLTAEQAAEFIQIFSKTVEHHKTYLETITVYVRTKRLDSIDYMCLLLRG